MELNKEMLETFVGQITAVDSKLEKAKGNVTERRNITIATLRNLEAANTTPDTVGVFTALDAIEAELATLLERKEAAKQATEDAIVVALKSSKDSTATEVEALKVQRAELVETVRAMSTLLHIEVEIPKAPKGASASSGSPKAKNSTGAHYVIENGERKFYSNDTFSGLAWFAFHHAGVKALEAALVEAGITARTTPWEATVTVNEITATVGMVVTTEGETPPVETTTEG